MTTLLQKAFEAVAKLSAAEQNLLAAWVLAELAVEDDFDQAIAASGVRADSTAGPGAVRNSHSPRRFRELLAALPAQVQQQARDA